jgi:hypothetical protein
MPFIAFLGCDGCGKSAVIAALATGSRAKGVAVATGHWRPFPFRGRGSAGTGSADNPHGAEPRGGIASVVKLLWLWLNWWVGWWGACGERRRGGSCCSTAIMATCWWIRAVTVTAGRWPWRG